MFLGYTESCSLQENFGQYSIRKMSEEGKVHIGNLPFRVTEGELRDRFEKYGPVEDGKLDVVK